MTGDPIKELALSMANNALGSSASSQEVVDRAAIYEHYLRGEPKRPETPLPIGEGGQPDALHG